MEPDLLKIYEITKVLQLIFKTSYLDINFLALCGITFILFIIWFYKILRDFTMFSSFVIFLISFTLPFVLFQVGISKIIEFLYKINPFLAFFIIVFFFFGSSFFEYLIMKKIKKSKELKEQLEMEKGKIMLKEIGKISEK